MEVSKYRVHSNLLFPWRALREEGEPRNSHHLATIGGLHHQMGLSWWKEEQREKQISGDITEPLDQTSSEAGRILAPITQVNKPL